MSPALRRTLVATAAVGALLWTLAAVAGWWLLQAVAGLFEGGSAASAMQALTAWTDRPWFRYWLDPEAVDALRDGLDWLFSLGGGPMAWLGTATTLLTAALVLFWAGGLVLGLLAVVATAALARHAQGWWRGAASARPAPPVGTTSVD